MGGTVLPPCYLGFPGGSEVKASACNEWDLGSIPGLGRSPGERNGNPLQYSWLENPMDGGAWWATVHGVAKSWTWLSDGGEEYKSDLLQKIPCMYCYTWRPQPWSRQPSTHAFTGHFWTLTGKSGSASCGITAPFSWVLVHTQGSVCAFQESISQPCVSFGSSMVRLMETSSKRAYAIRKSATPRVPVPVAVHSWPKLSQEMLNTVPSRLCGVPGSWWTRFVWALWVSLAGMGLDSELEFAPPTILLGLLLCPWAWSISSQLLLDRVRDELWIEVCDTV